MKGEGETDGKDAKGNDTRCPLQISGMKRTSAWKGQQVYAVVCGVVWCHVVLSCIRMGITWKQRSWLGRCWKIMILLDLCNNFMIDKICSQHWHFPITITIEKTCRYSARGTGVPPLCCCFLYSTGSSRGKKLVGDASRSESGGGTRVTGRFPLRRRGICKTRGSEEEVDGALYVLLPKAKHSNTPHTISLMHEITHLHLKERADYDYFLKYSS